MPRKSKITAVPVDQPEGLIVASTQEDEKTDAQEMTDIINEVKSDEAPNVDVPQASLEPETSSRTPVVKAKPKRASRAKAKALPEPVVEVHQPTLDEVVAEVELPKEEPKDAKAVEKVTCPDCGKQMSAKTLKYSHVPNCLAKKNQLRSDWSDAVQVAREAKDAGAHGNVVDFFSALDQVPEDVLEQKYVERKASSRLAKREKALEKLINNAFP